MDEYSRLLYAFCLLVTHFVLICHLLLWYMNNIIQTMEQVEDHLAGEAEFEREEEADSEREVPVT